jgi:hypothetical protein
VAVLLDAIKSRTQLREVAIKIADCSINSGHTSRQEFIDSSSDFAVDLLVHSIVDLLDDGADKLAKQTSDVS